MEKSDIEINNNKTSIPYLKTNKLIYKGKFLSYYVREFEINNQNKKILKPYEVVDYNSRSFEQNEIQNEFIGTNNYNIYAINIIPIIKYSSKPQKLIIVKVFRYPVNKFCLEFPAGFMDKTDIINLDKEGFSESIKKAALRELEEETGYKGKFINYTSKYFGNNQNLEDELKLGGNMFFDPWKSSDNAIQCLLEINGDEIGDKKCQKLDDTELIEVFEVEINKLMEFINEKINNENCGCSSELYNFALGFNFNNILNSIINN